MKFSKPAKSKQQLITLLEPRRLMSLTGGVDYTPTPDTAPTQITHSFGYEHALTNDGDAHPPMPMHADFGVPHGDFGGTEAHFARAIAQGSPISFDDSNGDNGSEVADSHVVPANAFTSMYTSLNHSTVMSIDIATPSATSVTLSAASNISFQASATGSSVIPVATSNVTINQDLAVATTEAAASTPTATSVGSTIAPAVTLPATVLGSTGTANADISAPSRVSLENVEQEFLTVSTLASEMISQLGRDIAIELSHLESNLSLDSIDGQFAAHWDGWRSAAAVTGAAIATIVYIQSEADREKPKTMPTFSRS